MYKDLHGLGGHVLHLAYLYLSLFGGFKDAVDELAGLAGRTGGLAKRNLCDGKGLVVPLLNLGPDADGSAALSVVVLAYIYAATGGEVGVKVEFLAVQIADGGVAEFIDIVGKNLATEANGNTFRTLCQQQGELDGKGNGLLVASVIRPLPFRGFGIEHHIQGEGAEACFDVTSGGSVVAGKDVAPVTLAVYQQVLLSQLYQCVLDAGVAMRMELHGVAHNIGHFVVASVIHALHGMQDAPLHGFEAVHNVWDSAFQDYIGSIIQEPVLVHLVQMMRNAVCIFCVVSHCY